VDREDLDYLAKASDDVLQPYRKAYWRRVRDARCDPTGKVFVDVQALNTVKLPLIVKLFPDAKLVLSVRDPRDAVLSAFTTRFPMNASTFELLRLDSCAAFFDLMIRLCLTCIERLQLPIGFTRLEDFVANPAAQARGVCEYLGLDPGPEAERVWSAEPLAQFEIGRWRNYERQLDPVGDILKPWVERFGYNDAQPSTAESGADA
jgi:hypothetical protein